MVELIFGALVLCLVGGWFLGKKNPTWLRVIGAILLVAGVVIFVLQIMSSPTIREGLATALDGLATLAQMFADLCRSGARGIRGV